MSFQSKYYRNLQEVAGIEPNALWRISEDGRQMVLVDEDQYLPVNIVDTEQELFENVPDPPGLEWLEESVF